LLWRTLTQAPTPMAILRVVDEGGRPVAGATILPEGLRTKKGPYDSGWYSWPTSPGSVPNPAVKTDLNGEVRVPYPQYVVERLETGTLCLRVNHADFVPDRPERVVNSAPPAGTPIRERIKDFAARFQRKQLASTTDPIVLKKGGILKITISPETLQPNAPLHGQVTGSANTDSNFWIQLGPGMIATRALATGTQAVRVVQFDAKGTAWFTDVKSVVAKPGETTELTLDLKRGVTLRGHIDPSVPRPIARGRVIAHVWPHGWAPQVHPPQWHSWVEARPDGSFEIESLPAGDLEVVAICQGFINTRGPGKTGMHYPKQHTLTTNDLEITIPMEPTTRLEVHVLDDKSQPLPDAVVSAWPNVRYGEWSATILGSDTYNVADWLQGKSTPAQLRKIAWHDFDGRSDKAGVAVLPNLPANVNEIAVGHDRFALPVVNNGRDERAHAVTLKLGVTNYATVKLEPIDKNPIAHR
jgi:hypothetical protein